MIGVAFDLGALFTEALDIWVKGGWAMYPIALNAFLCFGLATHVWLRLLRRRTSRVPERIWRVWVDHPRYRDGKLGRLIDAVTQPRTLTESAEAFAGLRASEVAAVNRDVTAMRICNAGAPLLGLLGTVTGMLSTFAALGAGSGGDETMAAISRGISEALITTETGLVVALPGMFLHYRLGRLRDRHVAFLAHLETVCTQSLHRRLSGMPAVA
jgi:biopolymer transport protein ExbB